MSRPGSTFLHDPMPVATLVLIAATVFVSVRAFKSYELKDRLIFSPRAILAGREYHRLFTSALLHADWMHLAFNMFTVLLFGQQLGFLIGAGQMLLIYCASIGGGSLLSLYLHRHHEYFALGASGGACGLVFASIFLLPGGEIMSVMLPIAIPSWAYAILFLIGEFYGARTQQSNIGHDAHLGGAIIGLLATTALHPQIVTLSPRLYATVMLLSIGIFFYFWKSQNYMPVEGFFARPPKRRPAKASKEKPTTEDVDAILDKVSREGIHSLTEAEQKILKEASRQ